MSAFPSNLYLQMLLDDTCLLVLSARYFRIPSCILKTVSVKILHIVFLFIFYIPKVFLKETLMSRNTESAALRKSY